MEMQILFLLVYSCLYSFNMKLVVNKLRSFVSFSMSAPFKCISLLAALDGHNDSVAFNLV